MSTFKFFFENKEADIADLKKMIQNPDPSKVKEYGGSAYVDMLKKKLSKLESAEEDAEIDAADGAMKGIKAKERLNFIDNIMFTYPGKSLAFYKKALKKSSHFKDGKLTPYELFTIKREMKRHMDAEHDEDAEDRCKRKADQVYGKKTSAYKSGAIVRCRSGKIWKKK